MEEWNLSEGSIACIFIVLKDFCNSSIYFLVSSKLSLLLIFCISFSFNSLSRGGELLEVGSSNLSLISGFGAALQLHSEIRGHFYMADWRASIDEWSLGSKIPILTWVFLANIISPL